MLLVYVHTPHTYINTPHIHTYNIHNTDYIQHKIHLLGEINARDKHDLHFRELS